MSLIRFGFLKELSLHHLPASKMTGHVKNLFQDGMTSLMHAAYRGNVALCQTLLEHKADANWNSHKDGVYITNVQLTL